MLIHEPIADTGPQPSKSLLPLFGILDVNQAQPEEVTLYVKGFNSRSNTIKQFTTWSKCHDQLVADKGWERHAFGYDWSSGYVYSFRGIPIPFVTLGYLATQAKRVIQKPPRLSRMQLWLSRPRTFGLAVLADVSLLAARLYTQFETAAKVSETQADKLAQHLVHLREQYARVRVVAHSLGCRHVIRAIHQIPPEQRPDEVHLLAPAVGSESVSALKGLSKDMTYLYHCKRDAMCGRSYRLVRKQNALGAVGVPVTQDNDDENGTLTVIDTDAFFGVFVHRQYQNRFHLFAQ
eukprot:TRINITY_DN14275_c0_g1_i1.p1 TRINITY_DN14275_c0_g1~~TRINITY_DN14275_c0_g1_i1.p1  ORF type:complete len:292 (-),score=36.24 TRINITY_DN14275_c0_g1_i1:729-1604(-)